ncbi:MAG: YkgJ family cysteine cluster protein [bacterium]
MRNCNQCGKCCIKYGGSDLSASQQDIELWEQFQPEIFQYVNNNKIWYQPTTNKPLKLCPWLEKSPDNNIYFCKIYFDRPEDCKFYPVTIEQMMNDGCEMLEQKDLKNPKSAQQKLDYLMEDSRPSIHY